MLEVKNLVQTVWQQIAVDDISFTVERGEILGFPGAKRRGGNPPP